MSGENKATERCFRIVELLGRHVTDGMRNKEIADALLISAVNVSRDLATLEGMGYALKLENGRWILNPRKMLGLWEACRASLEETRQRIAETERNIETAARRYGEHHG